MSTVPALHSIGVSCWCKTWKIDMAGSPTIVASWFEHFKLFHKHDVEFQTDGFFKVVTYQFPVSNVAHKYHNNNNNANASVHCLSKHLWWQTCCNSFWRFFFGQVYEESWHFPPFMVKIRREENVCTSEGKLYHPFNRINRILVCHPFPKSLFTSYAPPPNSTQLQRCVCYFFFSFFSLSKV